MIDLNLAYQVGGLLLTGGAIYGGIRADLKTIHAQLQEVKDDAAEANRRLDRHLEATAARR